MKVLIWMFFFSFFTQCCCFYLHSPIYLCILLSRRRVKLVVIFLSTFTFILFCRQKDPPLLWCVMCKAPGACLLSLHHSLSLSTLIHTHTHPLSHTHTHPLSHTHTHTLFLSRFFRMSAFHWSRMKIGQQLQQPSTYDTLEPNQKDFKYLCIHY